MFSFTGILYCFTVERDEISSKIKTLPGGTFFIEFIISNDSSSGSRCMTFVRSCFLNFVYDLSNFPTDENNNTGLFRVCFLTRFEHQKDFPDDVNPNIEIWPEFFFHACT